ncbi:Ltv1 [Symbiodinium pilosum]|uniref:Ltv1 protein n=1 Tax=Symbiodinium pilosum TaxID=2952 RepID=A0A812NKL9_SYMPI|nr:Ltv1 [Symbiodinium pilosum]
MGRRRFAKKGEDVRHFKLVARPGADDDDDKPPLVLEPFAPPGSLRRTGKTEAELLAVPESLQSHVGSAIYQPGCEEEEEERDGKRKKERSGGLGEDVDEDELDGDCYFPPDGYNYEQHLKSVSGTKKAKSVVGVVLEAPEPVKEEDFLKQQATNEDEEEVLRALDHVDEYEELEDDVMAEVVEGGLVEPDAVLWGPAALDSAFHPDMSIFAEHKALLQSRAMGQEDDSDFDDGLDEFEGGYKSGGAKASNAKPKDEDFERFMADQYGDDEIGARDEDDIEGQVELDDDVLDEYLEEKQAEQQELVSLYEPQRGFKDDEPRVIAETRAIIERHYLEEESEEETESGDESEDESRTWDCETVLSTLSNVSNRPGRIGKLKIVKKPVEKLKPVKESEGGNDDDDVEDVVELPDVVTTREKGETAEEKRARKASVKEMRRICRQMKKDSKEMYKKEAAKLPGQGGADLRQKTRTVKY